ncbi:replication protein [Kordia jejudonensis]|uniref:replication protein n=1 Tax=Kordia jejudonensis TaxID=1348245 RepID=UPI0006290E94|nr:replication protein [Kordia jejudonensis]
MSYIYHTNVPNNLFDIYLKDLGYAELKVFLVIIRQTYGWKDKRTNSYKHWDWISQQFFVRKTGLSARAVSTAISKLIYKRLIQVKNKQGSLLFHKIERQRESKLYFSCTLKQKSSELTSRKPMKKLHTTIIKHTNTYREDTSQAFKKIQFSKHQKP